jgi:translation initiation factor 4A
MSTENTNIFKTNNASNTTSSNNNNNNDIPLEIINTWDELDINRDLLRGIYAYGFEKPSPIQSKAIKPIIEKRDIIGQAQSGTGKTATFSIGALSRVNINDNYSQVLILSPTHELTHQTAKVITSLSTMMTGVRIKTILGGSSIDNDVDSMLATPPHILVGCPGRVYDMIRRGHINASKLSLVVIDEADEMLSQGFKEQIYNIFQYFSNDIQVALFSATLPENIYRITDKFMRNPVKISVTPEMLTLEGIKQYFVALNNDVEKYSTLKDIFQVISLSHCIIYCNSVKRVADLCEAMREDNFPVCCIHSYMDKAEREKSINEFRTGVARVLISSNVTARGIDIQQVSTVINFDIPKDVHTYLHRIGRSGRWGRKGTGINFITRRDIILLKEIERYYNTQIEELPANFAV